MPTATPIQDQLLRNVPTVDGYKVLEPAVLVDKLPEGGMAAVYRGLHLELKVDVAVKVLKPGQGQTYSAQAIARFRQEAEQAARLNDPNLVRIFAFPDSKLGLLYIVMEYIDGETLETRVQRKGKLTAQEAATIAYHANNGIRSAHLEKIIHRDIKPPNIMLTKRGQVKITDLGIAKAQDSSPMVVTQEIALLGTPQYMAPELWRGARFASTKSDVWALGATLGFMVSGRHLIDGADTQEIMHRCLTEGFPDVSRIVPGLPPQLVRIIRACTEPNPQDRPTTEELTTMLRELLNILHGECSLADPRAGGPATTQVSTRIPSRTDLDKIREFLDKSKVPTPANRALPPRQTPRQIVDEQRVRLFTNPPPRQNRAPVRKKAKSGGSFGTFVVIGVLSFFAVAGFYGVRTGWLDVVVRWFRGMQQPAQPTTQESPDAQARGAGTNPTTRLASAPLVPTVVPRPATTPAVAVAPTTKPGKVEPTRPTNPFSRTPVADVNNPAKPETPEKPNTRPPEGPPVSPPAVVKSPPAATAGYEESKRRINESADRGNWADALGLIATMRGQADAESRRDDFVNSVDKVLMRFRAAQADLARRRSTFPGLSDQLSSAVDAGSGVAALVSAEQQMSVSFGEGETHVEPADPAVGLSGAAQLLRKAVAGRHDQARADAKSYLVPTLAGQLDSLAKGRKWNALLASLGELPLRDLSADPDQKQALARLFQTVDQLLVLVRLANPDSKAVREAAGALNLDQLLTPYIDAGSGTAALLDADWLVAEVTAGSAARAIAVLEKARASASPAINQAASAQLGFAYVVAAREASGDKKWLDAIHWIARSKSLVTGPPDSAEYQVWRGMAETPVNAIRKAYPDLDARKQALPTLAKEVEPLAKAGVYAAMLVMAESLITYQADPPRPVASTEDPKFESTLKWLTPCLNGRDCPGDTKDDAANLQWGIFATFVPPQFDPRKPDATLNALKALAKCGGSPTREKWFDELVGTILKNNEAIRVQFLMQFSEEQLAFVEKDGERSIPETARPALTAIGQRLQSVRESRSSAVETKVHASALLGEVLRADRSTKAQAAAFRAYADSLALTKGKVRNDPIALVGKARFFQMTDAELDTLIPEEQAIASIRQLEPRDRKTERWKLCREAATTGDPYALYAAGLASYDLFGNDGGYMQSAAENHSAAAKAFLLKNKK